MVVINYKTGKTYSADLEIDDNSEVKIKFMVLSENDKDLIVMDEDGLSILDAQYINELTKVGYDYLINKSFYKDYEKDIVTHMDENICIFYKQNINNERPHEDYLETYIGYKIKNIRKIK